MQTVRIFGFFSALLCFTLIAQSQPKLKIAEGVNIDYGTIYSNQIMLKELTVMNEGTDTLIVTGVSSSCGCTVALMSKDHIPPKKSAKLSIRFDPERFTDKVTKGISFETNDPENPHAHVDFTVTISKIIEVSSDYITFAGIYPDTVAANEYTLKNLTDRPIKILSVIAVLDTVDPAAAKDSKAKKKGKKSPATTLSKNSAPPVLWAESDKNVMNPNEEITVKCILRPNKNGIVRGNINIDTDNPNMPHITTRVYALVKAKRVSN